MDVRDSRPRRARSTSVHSSVRILARACLVLLLAMAGAARTQDALSEAEEAVQRAGTPSERAAAHVALGRAYFSTREEDKAIAEFRAALTLDPHSGEAYLALGQVRFFQRNLPAAQQELRRAIEVAPDFTPAYAALGEVLEHQVPGQVVRWVQGRVEQHRGRQAVGDALDRRRPFGCEHHSRGGGRVGVDDDTIQVNVHGQTHFLISPARGPMRMSGAV